jgi:hypothetical protein
MSTRRTDYLVFYVGCHCNDEDGTARSEKYVEPFEDNANEEHITTRAGFAVIEDGMSGQYVVIGRILAKTTLQEGFPMTDCMEGCSLRAAETLSLLIDQTFPFLVDLKRDVKVWLFSHFH